MAKKEGLIRGNILGKRIDFSGSAVITPDPTLNLDECKLPYLMILEIYKLPVAKRILELGKYKLLNKAIDFVDECIDSQSPALYKICEDVIKDELERRSKLTRDLKRILKGVKHARVGSEKSAKLLAHVFFQSLCRPFLRIHAGPQLYRHRSPGRIT